VGDLLNYMDAPDCYTIVALRTGADVRELPFADSALGYFQGVEPCFTNR
jgi:hypothetical protein